MPRSEQPSGRRGDRSVEAAGQLDAHDFDFTWIEPVDEGTRQLGVDPGAQRSSGGRRASGDRFLFERLGGKQIPECHAIRLLDRQRPARHRRTAKAADAPVPRQTRYKDLAAPEGPVIAHAETIEGDADELAGQSRLRRRRRHVGVVMLDGDAPALGEVRDRVLSGEVTGMEVVGDVFGLDVEQPLEVRQIRLEGLMRQQILEIARVPRASVKVCLSSAPTARTWLGVTIGRRSGSGA